MLWWRWCALLVPVVSTFSAFAYSPSLAGFDYEYECSIKNEPGFGISFKANEPAKLTETKDRIASKRSALVTCLNRDSKITLNFKEGLAHGKRRDVDLKTNNLLLVSDYRMGLEQGVRNHFDSQGRLLELEEYRDGKTTGLAAHYHRFPEGSLESIRYSGYNRDYFNLIHRKTGELSELKCGKTAPILDAKLKELCGFGKASEVKLYGPTSGKIIREARFLNGNLSGMQKKFDEDGKLSRLSFVGKDKKEISEAVYQSEGKLSCLTCTPGERTGQAALDNLCAMKGPVKAIKLYGASGKVAGQISYLKGKIVGDPRFFYPTGKLAYLIQADSASLSCRGSSQLGEDVKIVAGGRKEFDLEGRLLTETTFKDDQKFRLRKFYLNGQKRQEILFGSKTQPTDISYFYDDEGGLLSSISTLHNMRNGTTRRMLRGKVVSEEEFKNDFRIALKRFRADGSIACSEGYEADGSRKSRTISDRLSKAEAAKPKEECEAPVESNAELTELSPVKDVADPVPPKREDLIHEKPFSGFHMLGE